ncbi:MAG: response regulator [Candidatus Devosia symbiotica]|nr:response regulator [Candidatus Devosia symbiotica]
MTIQFDFILMDWYMPEISGAGLMTILRNPRFGEPSATPVILMTGYASRKNIAKAPA